jgi:hypothetical protein
MIKVGLLLKICFKISSSLAELAELAELTELADLAGFAEFADLAGFAELAPKFRFPVTSLLW